MLFDKLANVITKHYKKVLIAWVLILIISVPAILQVNEVVSYESTGVTSGDYESVKANEIIISEFQGSVANGTILIVLQADDVTDVPSRDYVLSLQDKVLSSTDLNDFTGITSAYTINSMVMSQTILALGPTMRPAEQQVNSTAFLLWGVPAIHVSNWGISYSDSEAFNATSVQLVTYLNKQGASQEEIQLTMGYYYAFAAAWNATAADPSLVADPVARADFCVNSVAPNFIASLPLTGEQKQVMMGVLYSFDLTSFNDPAAVHAFTLGMISQASTITNMTFLQEVYDLGPSYSPEVVDSYVSSIISSGTLATYPVKVPTQYLSSLVSSNNQTMLVTLSFSVAADYVTEDGVRPLFDNVDIVRGLIGEVNSETGNAMTAYVTGEAAISADMMSSSMEDMALIEPFTIIIIFVLMGILFRSVVAQFLPLGAVAVALGISQALVFVIGSTVAQIDSTVLTILFALLMGIGTDYSIFIITRYREERIKGATREEAVHTSITWAGESIVTSGLTVMISFFAMALASFSFVQTMGLVMGMAIFVALMVSLTLIPAVLMLVGNRVFWPNIGQRWKRYANNVMQKKREGNHGYFHQAASFGVKHAKIVVVVAIIVSIPATYIYLTAEPSFDFIGSMGDSESIQGMNALSEDFGAGRIMPTQVVITGDTYVYENGEFNMAYLDAIENLTASIAADMSMVQQVTGVTRPYGTLVDYHNISYMPEEQQAILVNTMLQSVGSSNKTVLLTVVLKPEPQSNEAVAYISTLRELVIDTQTIEPELAESTILVGGSTASLYDLSSSINEQFGMIEIIVVIGIFIVLMIVLGSLLLPLFAVLSIAMSIVWSFALTYLIFGEWLGVPILFIVPLVLFVMLMGIGMDYNVFILTRIREEVHKGKGLNLAIVDAVDWTGGIITALALIMAGAFGSLMLSSNDMLVMFGFALTVAILIDAMIVRTYIVPAAMSLMGKWAWWAPGRLQREGREEKMKKG
jgi:putative drug exporter of the RND superfamily